MVNAAQRRCRDFDMLMLLVRSEATMSDRIIPSKPDDSTIPAVIESGELNPIATEVGEANWKDSASSQPKQRYSYDVAEM
jgi:hypothetical protein